MLVKGNSGFGVELVDELTVRKSISGTGAARLKKQIEKQDSFQAMLADGSIRVPKIFRTATKSDGFSADMEFIAAKDFVQFLSEASRQRLDDFLNTISGFIETNLATAQNCEVSGQIQAKLLELGDKGVPQPYVQAARSLCQQPVWVPVGKCHGDLTLSNLLFKNTQLYLIDFLDCFVESPLQDIVKLRQDTFFGWSLVLYQAEFNWPRVQIALRYLDQKIAARFEPLDWYRQHYRLFQLVNLMRVLPYCAEARTTSLITGGLNQMLADMKVPAR